MIEIIKKNPPKEKFRLVKKYENIKVIKTVSTEIIDNFFKKFPEEKQGRKSFKLKEKEIMTLLAYDQLILKCVGAKCDCIGNIKEILKNGKLEIRASFFNKLQ